MRCGSPKVWKSPDGKNRREYPCLACPSCCASGRSELAQRIKLELSCWAQSTFVTLTFRPEDYPSSRADLELKWRHARRDLEFRAFWVMERGDAGGRVHFHALVFGQPFFGARDFWDKRWSYGRTSVDLAKSGAPSYLSRYLLKGVASESLVFHPDGLGEPLKSFPRKPALGALAGDAMGRAALRNAHALELIRTLHDVSSVHRYDGRIVRTPRAVRDRMRSVVGLPSSSPARARVQALRRQFLEKDRAELEKRRLALAAKDATLSIREDAIRRYRDPGLSVAHARFASAVESGQYETRSARRKRLAAEREIEGLAELLDSVIRQAAKGV